MDAHRSQLSSSATTLEDLTARLAEVADAYRDSSREDITLDLDEVERSLRAATRRLNRLVRRLA
jgi:predicted AAA+ superfamily ATPase